MTGLGIATRVRRPHKIRFTMLKVREFDRLGFDQGYSVAFAAARVKV
jgi:hypothetical protein